MRSLGVVAVLASTLLGCATAEEGEVVVVDASPDVDDAEAAVDVTAVDVVGPMDVPVVPVDRPAVSDRPAEAAVSCGEFKSRCGGACVDTLAANDHCGACDSPCRAAVGEVARCVAGMCTTRCAEGFGDCDGDRLTGCEVNLTDSVLHCGACGRGCNVLMGGTTRCEMGRCVEQCPGSRSVCGARCVDLNTDSTHCGACGRVCATGESCMGGRCLGPSGYRVTRNHPEATWVDACALPGHATVLTDTDGGTHRAMLPFGFRYWGVPVAMGATVLVTPDGYITFDADGPTPANGIIPNRLDNVDAVIAIQWRDLRTRGPGVCLGVTGEEGSRRWVIQWSDARYFTSALGHLNFEIVLNEGSHAIDFVYASQTLPEPATVALESWDGTRSSVPFDIPQPIVFSNTRARFTPE